MELPGGYCHWPATLPAQPFEEDDDDKEAAEGVEEVGKMDARQEQRADWMYDYTVCQFQYLTTRDNLEPYLLETDIQEKDKKRSQNDKTEHGNVKSMKSQSQP
ncbi:hypothetical protein Tco_0070034, partial [Tanacetum coccineum]